MLEIIGWILYIGCILYTLSGLLYTSEQVKKRGSVSYINLTYLFFTLFISIVFAFIPHSIANLLWIVPTFLIIGITPLSRLFGTFMTYLTFFLFKNNSTLETNTVGRKELDMEKILEQADTYFGSGDFASVINLCENAIKYYKEDYRFYSALCRSYQRLLPSFVDYDSLSDKELKFIANCTTKSINYGEQTLLILINNISRVDEDLFLTTGALADLNEVLIKNYLLISRILSRGLKTDYTHELNNNLKEKLIKHYKQGFPKFDSEFEEYKDHEENY